MKDCPTCGMPVDGESCLRCGTGKSKAALGPPDNHRCAHEFLGIRCTSPGAISHSTHGSGPWYCGVHFAPNRAKGAAPPAGFKHIRDVARGTLREPGSDDV